MDGATLAGNTMLPPSSTSRPLSNFTFHPRGLYQHRVFYRTVRTWKTAVRSSWQRPSRIHSNNSRAPRPTSASLPTADVLLTSSMSQQSLLGALALDFAVQVRVHHVVNAAPFTSSDRMPTPVGGLGRRCAAADGEVLRFDGQSDLRGTLSVLSAARPCYVDTTRAPDDGPGLRLGCTAGHLPRDSHRKGRA